MKHTWDQLLMRNPEVTKQTESPKLRKGSCSVAQKTGHQVEGRRWAKTWKMSRWSQCKKHWKQHLEGRAMHPVELPPHQGKSRDSRDRKETPWWSLIRSLQRFL